MEVPAAVSGTAQAHHGSRGRARVLAPAQISSRGVDVGDTADRGAKAAPFRPPLGTGRAPGKAPPSAENAFPIDCRSELGESSSCHDTSFPRFARTARPALGGLRCFWANSAPQKLMTAGRLAAIGGGVQRGCRNVAGTLAFGAGKTAFVTTLTANQPGGVALWSRARRGRFPIVNTADWRRTARVLRGWGRLWCRV